MTKSKRTNKLALQLCSSWLANVFWVSAWKHLDNAEWILKFTRKFNFPPLRPLIKVFLNLWAFMRRKLSHYRCYLISSFLTPPGGDFKQSKQQNTHCKFILRESMYIQNHCLSREHWYEQSARLLFQTILATYNNSVVSINKLNFHSHPLGCHMKNYQPLKLFSFLV